MRFLCCFLLGVAVVPGPLSAAPEAPGSEAPSAGLAALSDIARSLQHMEALLRAQLEMQRVEVLFRRAEIVNQEILPLQAALRQAKATRDGDEQQIVAGEQRLKELAERLDSGSALARGTEAKDIEEAIHQLELGLRMTRASLQAERAHVEELENEVSKRSAERDQVHSLIDRALTRLDTPQP